jgi:LPXTG-motif cell wall-anchored protein
MHQRSRRRLTRATATGFVVAVAAASAGVAGPVYASSAPYAPAYSASSSASLVRVTALDATPLGIQRGNALVDLKIATAGSNVHSKGTPQSNTGAAYLDGSLLGQELPDVPQASVRQQAAPDNAQPNQVQVQPLDLGLARVGLGRLRAHARWNPGTSRPVKPATVTESAGAIANLTVIPGAGLPAAVPFVGASVLDLPHTAYAQSKTDIVKVHGQRGLGVSSAARVSAAQLTLFRGSPQQHTIKIISPPTLVATATGTHRSSVRYTSPVVVITDARGRELYRLDSPDEVFEIPLASTPDLPGLKRAQPKAAAPKTVLPAVPGVPGVAVPKLPQVVPGVPGVPGLDAILPDLGLGGDTPGRSGPSGSGPSSGTDRSGSHGGGGMSVAATGPAKHGALLRLSLGHLEKRVTATAVSGKAATLRLEVLDLPQTGKLLDVAFGDLRAAAQVPPGGLLPPPAVRPSPTPAGNAGGSLPVTGSSLTWVLAAGVGLLLVGRLAIVLARRNS